MSFQQVALGAGLIILGAAFAFALQSILQASRESDPIVAVVNDQQIRQSDVDDEAGCELQTAMARIQELRHEAREYLIGKHLIEAEALRSQRTYHKIFATEIAGRVIPVSDARVYEVAATYAPGADPSPELLITVRNQLEAEATRRRIDQYLTELSAKYLVERPALDSARHPAAAGVPTTNAPCDNTVIGRRPPANRPAFASLATRLPLTAQSDTK